MKVVPGGQTTLARVVTCAGTGLHTGRRARVTLHPAPADHGRQATFRSGQSVPLTWPYWTPSRMSTAVAYGGARLRTIEHLMAALAAHGLDNVRIEVDGAPELPIFDGSAAPWCDVLRRAGRVTLGAPRRAIRVTAAVQVAHDGGLLRIEPAPAFAVDVTHDLLPAFPVMRWRGAVDAATFDAEIAPARSFGNLHRRLGLTPPAASRPPSDVVPHALDAARAGEDAARWAAIADAHATRPADGPLLRGWRPWRATVVLGRRILPPRRFPDEPIRHVVLDMIGDLALAGVPLIGRVTAHNPSHEKTYALVAELMSRPDRWTWT